jgi:hypothetical protein
MSIRQALKIRKQFTVEQKQFAAEQKIDAENTAAGWIDFLEEIAEFDSYVDEAKKKTKNIMITLIIVAVVCLFGTIFTAGALLPFFLLAFVAMIIYIAIYMGLNKIDIPNRLRLFVFPLIRMLKDEMKDQAKIYIKADFNTGMKKEYLTQKIDGKYDKNTRKKVDNTLYSYPILELKTRFADGNALSLYINDSSRKSSIRKTNYRGKTKYKTKYKIKTNVEVILAAKVGAYTFIGGSRAGTTSSVLYNQKDDKHIITYRHVKISATDEYIPELDLVLSAIATTYQQLKPIE